MALFIGKSGACREIQSKSYHATAHRPNPVRESQTICPFSRQQGKSQNSISSSRKKNDRKLISWCPQSFAEVFRLMLLPLLHMAELGSVVSDCLAHKVKNSHFTIWPFANPRSKCQIPGRHTSLSMDVTVQAEGVGRLVK